MCMYVIFLYLVHCQTNKTNKGSMKRPSSTGAGATGKMERKTVEKNRRIQMKRLCFNLASLIPSPPSNPNSKVMGSQMEQATNYIVKLRSRVQQLKERKAQLALMLGKATRDDVAVPVTDYGYPIMELRDLGSCLEVILVSGLRKNFMLFQLISVLEEEGAEVFGVNVATFGNKVYHTLHAKVKIPRVEVETSRIGGRLHELMSGVTPFTYEQIDVK